MNTLLNLVLRFSGLNALWDKADGHKSKIGGAGLMCAGAGIMLTAVAQIISAYVACADHSCQIALFKSLSSSDHVKLLMEGLITFKGGLLGLGLAHKLEKAAEASAPAE